MCNDIVIEHMKVAILTLRIHSNFGYLMQLYALQKVVRRLGHEPYTFYIKEEQPSCKAKAKEVVYNLYMKYVKKEDIKIFKKWITDKERTIIDKNTWEFVNSNIQLTDYLRTPQDFYGFDASKYDAYIVGSDQVWREPYSINLPLYYFSFLRGNQKRMSYAASFGKSNIDEYSAALKKRCGQLIKEFSIVTVREKDGVDICSKEFGVEAKQVVDPTLLLPALEYKKLADKGKKHNDGKPYIFTYILDSTPQKWNAINIFAQEEGLVIINLLPPKIGTKGTAIEDYIYPKVYDILSGFANSEYVITDSFHACVFSLIFKRQFYVFPNEKIGNSRIISLLSDYGITNRVIKERILKESINYDSLETNIINKIELSLGYLKSFLNE